MKIGDSVLAKEATAFLKKFADPKTFAQLVHGADYGYVTSIQKGQMLLIRDTRPHAPKTAMGYDVKPTAYNYVVVRVTSVGTDMIGEPKIRVSDGVYSWREDCQNSVKLYPLGFAKVQDSHLSNVEIKALVKTAVAQIAKMPPAKARNLLLRYFKWDTSFHKDEVAEVKAKYKNGPKIAYWLTPDTPEGRREMVEFFRDNGLL